MKAGELEIPTSPRAPLRLAAQVIGIGVFGLLLWSLFAQLEAGAVAPGEVVPADYTKTLQHLEGGTIREIKVKDGDRVIPGQELIVLDETEGKANAAILEYQTAAQQALVDRLAAERDGKPMPPVDRLVKQVPAVETQLRLFEARRNSLRKDLAILGQRRQQTLEEIEGLAVRQKALKTQLGYANEQSDMMQKLHEKNFISRPQLLDRGTKLAEVEGDAGQNSAELARARQKAVETELEIDRLKNNWLNDVLEALRTAQTEFAGYQEKLAVARERLSHMRLTAPHEGTVKGMRYTNAGAVITPNSPVVDIVPDKERLVIEAQISPDDIDVVRPGLESYVRLTAYKARYHRSVKGKVTRVSADAYKESGAAGTAQTGRVYYRARIEIDEGELKKLSGVHLTPGMQAQVEIVLGSRSALRYLFDPIRESFYRAFREE
jgi:HlyD family type I secretion membrane fusion protein